MPTATSRRSNGSRRERILNYLSSQGGRIDSVDGRGLTSKMAARVGYDNIAALNAILARLERDGETSMATKAQRFRSATERSGPKKPKRPRRARRDVPVDTSQAGVSATDRRAGFPRKASPAVAGKASYAFEPAEARPSRKSTRKSGSRQRTDRKMQAKRRTAMMRPRTPTSRSGR